ncbi:MAG: helix-turn-helix domain-containing protein [Caldilineaceae bacterium]|nr:helix-turn-helix domain-containing protein [Caldilineaceae bacterium]
MRKRINYPKTTVQQRTNLFQTWEATGDIDHACSVAAVSRSTFYYWKDRFVEYGYDGLGEVRQALPPINRLPDSIAEEIVRLKQTHPTWGKWQIARTLAEQYPERNNLSPNTVRRVLTAAGLWW